MFSLSDMCLGVVLADCYCERLGSIGYRGNWVLGEAKRFASMKHLDRLYSGIDAYYLAEKRQMINVVAVNSVEMLDVMIELEEGLVFVAALKGAGVMLRSQLTAFNFLSTFHLLVTTPNVFEEYILALLNTNKLFVVESYYVCIQTALEHGSPAVVALVLDIIRPHQPLHKMPLIFYRACSRTKEILRVLLLRFWSGDGATPLEHLLNANVAGWDEHDWKGYIRKAAETSRELAETLLDSVYCSDPVMYCSAAEGAICRRNYEDFLYFYEKSGMNPHQMDFSARFRCDEYVKEACRTDWLDIIRFLHEDCGWPIREKHLSSAHHFSATACFEYYAKSGLTIIGQCMWIRNSLSGEQWHHMERLGWKPSHLDLVTMFRHALVSQCDGGWVRAANVQCVQLNTFGSDPMQELCQCPSELQSVLRKGGLQALLLLQKLGLKLKSLGILAGDAIGLDPDLINALLKLGAIGYDTRRIRMGVLSASFMPGLLRIVRARLLPRCYTAVSHEEFSRSTTHMEEYLYNLRMHRVLKQAIACATSQED